MNPNTLGTTAYYYDSTSEPKHTTKKKRPDEKKKKEKDLQIEGKNSNEGAGPSRVSIH